jgi:hypothetical protein
VEVFFAVLAGVFTTVFLAGVLVVAVNLLVALFFAAGLALGWAVVLLTVAGLREASLDSVGAANTGMVATLNNPTPTQVRNFLLNIIVS